MEQKPATLHPYLTFDGNCREAMEFYQKALGGELSCMTFGDVPAEASMGISDEHKGRIMHAHLRSGDIILMASDTMPGQSGEITIGNASSLSINATNLEESTRFFENLSEGGNVTMEFQPTFWGATFGMFVDRFGQNWMVNCQHEPVDMPNA